MTPSMRRRVAELVEHNRQLYAEILRVLETHRPETAWDIARHLTWSRSWESLQAFSLHRAVSETASHVVCGRSQVGDIDVPVIEPRSDCQTTLQVRVFTARRAF